jgi:hypothetical protein
LDEIIQDEEFDRMFHSYFDGGGDDDGDMMMMGLLMMMGLVVPR